MQLHAGSVGGVVMVEMTMSRVLGNAPLECAQTSNHVADILSDFVTISTDVKYPVRGMPRACAYAMWAKAESHGQSNLPASLVNTRIVLFGPLAMRRVSLASELSQPWSVPAT